MPIYDKPVRLLMKEMVPGLGIKKNETFTREQVEAWFSKSYPKIKPGTISAHLIRLSTNAPSRVHYKAKPDDDVFFQLDGSRFRLYDAQTDPPPIHEGVKPSPGPEAEPPTEFAYESDLRNFLAKNLSLVEPGLHLYDDKEGINGIEFPVGGRLIDILAVDAQNNYVVIELKVSRGYDRVVGQLLRYVAWIAKNQAEAGQKVRGMIIAREISDDLLLACSSLPMVELFEYELSVSLKKRIAN